MTAPPLPQGPFDVLAADPPWAYRNYSPKGNGRSAEQHYRTMPVDQIAALPVKAAMGPNAHAFLWITGPLLAQGAHGVGIQADSDCLRLGQEELERRGKAVGALARDRHAGRRPQLLFYEHR
jgi:hypothetical protein